MKKADKRTPSPSKKYRVLLSSCGNPDFGQYSPISNPSAVDGDTIAELRKASEEYQKYWNLGGGNWDNGRVIDNRTGLVVAHFSYNLRLWQGDIPRHPSIRRDKELFHLA